MHAKAEHNAQRDHPPLFWSRLVLVVGLTLFAGVGWSLAASSSTATEPPLDPDRSWDALLSRKEDLMVKYMDLDPFGLRGKGRMVLHSLHPLVGMVIYDKVGGNPELWLKQMAGSMSLAHWLLERQNLGEIKLTGLQVLMTSGGIDFKFDRAEIGDGHLSKGRGRFTLNGQWAIRTGPLWLARPPFKELEKPLVRPMGYGSMDAYGSKGKAKVILKEAFALDASTGHAVIDAEWNEAATQGITDKIKADIVVEMSVFRVNDAFFEQGPRDLARALLAYAGLTPSWGMAFRRITLSSTLTGPLYQAKTLRLSSPNLQIWGEAKGRWNPMPGSIILDLTAKSPGKEARNFSWSSETQSK
ncbi:MAG: hypothetical protein H7829_18215 [Magnetococcus sp. THC-1_WYH]